MTRMPRVTGKDVVKALQRSGFTMVRVTGSHHHLYKEGRQLVTIPVHPGETLSPVLLKSILKQAGLTMDELIELL